MDTKFNPNDKKSQQEEGKTTCSHYSTFPTKIPLAGPRCIYCTIWGRPNYSDNNIYPPHPMDLWDGK